MILEKYRNMHICMYIQSRNIDIFQEEYKSYIHEYVRELSKNSQLTHNFMDDNYSSFIGPNIRE